MSPSRHGGTLLLFYFSEWFGYQCCESSPILLFACGCLCPIYSLLIMAVRYTERQQQWSKGLLVQFLPSTSSRANAANERDKLMYRYSSTQCDWGASVVLCACMPTINKYVLDINVKQFVLWLLFIFGSSYRSQVQNPPSPYYFQIFLQLLTGQTRMRDSTKVASATRKCTGVI